MAGGAVSQGLSRFTVTGELHIALLYYDVASLVTFIFFTRKSSISGHLRC